jgi:hypothetical protein
VSEHALALSPAPRPAVRSVDDIRSVASQLEAGDCEAMMELAVSWVARNPEPIPLPPPAYQR